MAMLTAPDPAHNAERVGPKRSIARAALAAWYAATEFATPASDVVWGSHKDCWADGWEMGYRAGALGLRGFERRRRQRAPVRRLSGGPRHGEPPSSTEMGDGSSDDG